MILLDTYVAVWFVTNTKFGKRTMTIVDAAQAEARLAVSAISFWEIALLVARRRLRAIRSAAEQRTKILTAGMIELPLTGEIAVLAGELEACTAIRQTGSLPPPPLSTMRRWLPLIKSCCAGAIRCAGRTPSFDLKDCSTSSAVPYSQSTAPLAGSIRCM